MPQDREKPWVIREVAEQTRRDVKAFAVKHGLSMAQAIEQIVDAGLSTIGVAINVEKIEKELHEEYLRKMNERSAFTQEMMQMIGEEGMLAVQKVIEHYTDKDKDQPPVPPAEWGAGQPHAEDVSNIPMHRAALAAYAAIEEAARELETNKK